MMKSRFSACAGESAASAVATDRTARRTRMACSLGMAMDGAENAAESVKVTLTLRANLRPESIQDAGRRGVGPAVPKSPRPRRGEVLSNAGLFRGGRRGN